MPILYELKSLAKYCKGLGANVGCGDHQIADSIGVDISATAKAAQTVADACDLPFGDGDLDYIVASACFEHIDKGPITILREWLRCVKVGGTIAVLVPDAKYGIWAMTGDTGTCGKFTKAQRSMEHLHAFTQESLILLFEFAGMEVMQCKIIDRVPVRPERTLLCVGKKLEIFE